MVLCVLIAALLAAVSTPALAQSPGPDGRWAFILGAGTDNRSWGLSRSDGEAFVFGATEWENASGLVYARSGFQTIKSAGGSDLELAFGAGLRPEVAGFDLDLNLTYNSQIGGAAGFDDTAWELTADVRRSIGPASGHLRLQYSPDGTGSTEAWTWVEARLGWDFTDRLQARVEIGRREQDNNLDYTAWNVGLAYALTRNLEGELRYYATDADVPGEHSADTLVAGISLAF